MNTSDIEYLLTTEEQAELEDINYELLNQQIEALLKGDYNDC